MRTLFAPLLTALAVIASPAAAVVYIDFTVEGLGQFGSQEFSSTGPITLATNDNGDGSYTAFAATGYIHGEFIEGIDQLYGSPDNTLYHGVNLLSSQGISFRTASSKYNVYQTSTYTGLADQRTNFTGAGAQHYFVAVSAVLPDYVAPGVPEPSTWALMVVGFGLVGVGVRSRSRAIALA